MQFKTVPFFLTSHFSSNTQMFIARIVIINFDSLNCYSLEYFSLVLQDDMVANNKANMVVFRNQSVLVACILLLAILQYHRPNQKYNNVTHLNTHQYNQKDLNVSHPYNIMKTPHFINGTQVENRYGIIFEEGEYIQEGNNILINLDDRHFLNETKSPNYSSSKAPSNNRPTPVVFISAGSSGSSNTWMTLSKLAGGEVNLAREDLGSTPDQVKLFMDTFRSEEYGAWWVHQHLYEVSRLYARSNIAGFQWKPYSNSLLSSFGQGVLKGIAGYNANITKQHSISSNHASSIIRVLLMTRNRLDVIISNIKHKNKREIGYHCDKDDEQCSQQHNVKVTLPTDVLLQKLRYHKTSERRVESILQSMGVEYYRTSYERLYNTNNIEEWKKILSYLGHPIDKMSSMKDIEAAFPYSKTTTRSRRDILENYDEVRNVLEGTEFEALLLDNE